MSNIIYASITLVHAGRTIPLSVLVNRSFHSLALNEAWQAELKLPVIAAKEVKLSNGEVQFCNIAGPLTVSCLGREISCNVLILPGDTPPYLGSGPLLELGLLVDAEKMEVVVDNTPSPGGKIYL
ncbi:hypothetical protein [uncultured Chitinophaga sp.]|uniref:hypothetical protein n=1 Tax=uncultured Chitinophaga sp. TaxID=339340 RepID=UPI0025FDABA0|nr:hypothetical protein [uncultured Chitinophaga sp.]